MNNAQKPTTDTRIQEAFQKIKNPDSAIRKAGIIQLGFLKYSPAIPKLIELLRDKDKEVRLAAARALGKIADVEAVSEILNKMRDVWISSARRLAAELLGMRQDVSAIPGLIWLMRDESMLVRTSAARSLQKLEWTPTHDENEIYYHFALQSWDKLIELRERAIPILAEYLFSQLGSHTPYLTAVVSTLHQIGTEQALKVLEQWGNLNQSVNDIAEKTPVSVTALIDSTAQEIIFWIYIPQTLPLGQWETVAIYLFKSNTRSHVETDLKHQAWQASAIPYQKITHSLSQFISEEDFMTITPHLPYFQANPSSIRLGFWEDWHRVEFRIKAKDIPASQHSQGFIKFALSSDTIIDIEVSIDVSQK